MKNFKAIYTVNEEYVNAEITCSCKHKISAKIPFMVAVENKLDFACYKCGQHFIFEFPLNTGRKQHEKCKEKA